MCERSTESRAAVGVWRTEDSVDVIFGAEEDESAGGVDRGERPYSLVSSVG